MNSLRIERDSSLYVYKPFIGILQLVGCMPGVTGKPVPAPENWLFCEFPYSWHSVAYGLQHFILVHYAFRCFFHVGSEDFWPIAVEFLRAFASFATVHLFTGGNQTFHRLLKEMDMAKGSATENIRMAKITRRTLGLCVFYISVRCILDMMRVVAPKNILGHNVNFTFGGNGSDDYVRFIPATSRLEEYAKHNWYGADLSGLSSTTTGFLAIYGSLEVALFRFLCSGSFAFALTMFANLCHHFTVKYTFFNEEIEDILYAKEGRNELTAENLRHYRKTLSLLARASMFLSGFCAEITALFSEVSTSHEKVEDDPLVELNVTLDGAFLIFWFYYISVGSSRIYEAATRCIRPFQHLSSRKSCQDVDFALQSRLLFDQLQNVRVGLTAWNFFIINRAAILTIGGALITYLIVVIQMNPVAVRMLLTATTSQGNSTHEELD